MNIRANTPFDTIIQLLETKDDQNNRLWLIAGHLRVFRVLYYQSKELSFFQIESSHDFRTFQDNLIKSRLIFWNVISQLNVLGGLIESSEMPRKNRIRLFRNMCIEHYDSYLIPAHHGFGVMASRKIDGTFPVVYYAAGRNRLSLHVELKSRLAESIQRAGFNHLDVDLKQLDQMEDDLTGDCLYKLLSAAGSSSKTKDLRQVIWDWGLPPPFLDTDSYFKDEFLPFISELVESYG